jgi:hypothetical protein
MAVESSNTVNQPPIDSSSSFSTNTIKRVLPKNQNCYSKNTHSRLNPKSFPTATNKSFTIFHQNIRGLGNKTNELLESVLPKLPHVICLTQHHSKEHEIKTVSIDHYILGAKLCRQSKTWSTGIFVHEALAFTNTDLQQFCTEQDIETYAVKINLLSTMLYVICIYRSPTGNFVRFIKHIDTSLHQFSKPNIEIIVRGDINTDYLDENCHKRRQLGALLATYSLNSTV